MSMWEIEALGEEAIIMVDQTDLPTERKRDLILSIYDAIGAWDVSFIHFRTPDILVRNACFFSLDPADHPEYQARKSELDIFVAEDKSWLTDPQTSKVEAIYTKPNQEAPKQFWFDPSMALWGKAVEAGLLNGLAAQDPKSIDKPELMATLMAIASDMKDDALAEANIKLFHGFMAYDANQIDPQNPHLQAALNLPRLSERLNRKIEGPRDWIEERFNAKDALEYADGENLERLKWWCAPYN